MISFKPRPYLLSNTIQHYTWGTRGKEAFIPRFLGIEPEQDRPYAELWIGAHPKAPSDVILNDSGVSLPQLISQYPLEILGSTIAKFSGAFPFLLKVVSAAEVLSIQAHPNKEQAQFLHAKDPEHYPDDNHKPEIAIAIDSLTALIGFRNLSEILQSLAKYPELADFVGQENVSKWWNFKKLSGLEQREAVRMIYSALMRRAMTLREKLAESINQLGERLDRSVEPLSEEEQLFLQLYAMYPTDASLFLVFLLNLIHLEKGQGVFISAGTLHAYLKGNTIECMATSDNVVRAGLTQKFKDTETLVDILNYDTEPIPILGGNSGLTEVIYPTPTTEFQISRWNTKPGEEKCEETRNTPEVLLVTKGRIHIGWRTKLESGEQMFQQGQSILIPAFLQEFKLWSKESAELFMVSVPL